MKNNNVVTLDQFKDEYYGKPGSQRRDELALLRKNWPGRLGQSNPIFQKLKITLKKYGYLRCKGLWSWVWAGIWNFLLNCNSWFYRNMETNNGVKAVYAPTRKEWRSWLQENHQSEKSVCLIIYHKNSKVPSVYYDESVEEALCFGWIDSKANKRDEESYYLYFAQRKPKSNWSKANR